MINRKQLAVSILFASIFLTIAAVPLSLQQVTYDAWADINDDGKIDIRDIAYTAQRFGTAGDPTKNVNITNWPIGILPTSPMYIYSVPFVVSSNPYNVHPNPYGLGPGIYETDILIHNPSPTKVFDVRKKIVEAFPEGQPHMQGYFFGVEVLNPDDSFRIDSDEILRVLNAPQPVPVHKGYIGIITTSPYLDVHVVYTVSTFDPADPTFTIAKDTMSIETLTISPKPYI